MTSFYGGGAASISGGGGSSVEGALIFKGTLGIPDDGATVLALPDMHEEGWTYLVVTAGTYAGQLCEKGDFVICVSSGESASDLDWTVVQGNTFNTLPTPTALDEGKIISVDALGNYTLIDNPVDNKLDKNNGTATGTTTFDKAQANRLELLVDGESIGGFRSIDLTPAVTDNGDDSSMRFVPLFIGEPTKDAHAATKKYVDDKTQIITQSVETETERATEAETALQTAINTEITDRKAADNATNESIQSINQSIESIKDSYLLLAGGELTGPVSTTETEFEENELVNKKYVDENVASVYPTEIVQGNPVVCEDGAEYGLQGLKIFGKSTQVTTTGAQLLDTQAWQTVDPEFYKATEDGEIILLQEDGRASSKIQRFLELDAGNYTASTKSGFFIQVIKDGASLGESTTLSFALDSLATLALKIFPLSPINYPSQPVYAMINAGSSVSPWEPYTGGQASPNPNYPQEIVSAGDGGSIDLTVSDGADQSQSLTISTPNGLPGIPVDSGGNYTDAEGQQSACDVKDYGIGKYTQMVGHIESYNGETITTPYMSTTGQLSTGAEVYYVLDEPVVTDISADELAAYRALHAYDGTTTISTSEDVSGIEVQYLKKNRALPASSKQDAGRVVTVNDQGQFSLTDKYLDGVDLDSIFSLFIDGKNTTEMFWKWYPLTDKYGSTKYDRLERWCKLLANAWSNKTYTLRFYKASVSGDYTGTPLDDLADGRQAAAPLVTDSSEPTEDWTENDPMTWYIRANALSLADGTMDILYFEGEDGFDITGEIAPVYSFALNLYLKHWTDDSYKYTSWKTVKADGYNSMAEGIAPDETYRAVTWHPAFNGGLNASGGMTSGANKKPVIWTSAQDALPLARKITPYEGLWTDCDQQYVLSQWQLRHWTLENSDVLNGCQNYNYQYTLAVAESDVKRLIVTTEQGANFIVGSNVCLGEKGVNESIDRNQAYNHDIFNCATITSIENVNISEAEYTALNLDIEEPITTTTTMLVSTIPWPSGTTEALQGHSDGCIGNLTNGKYPIRVAGIEMMNGAYINGTEPLWRASIVEDHWHYEVYSCRDSEKQAGSRTGDYVKTGEFDLPNASEYTWHYITKLNASTDEAIIPMTFGGSSSTYYRSAFASPGGSGDLLSPWRGGPLHDSSSAGLACAAGYFAPSSSGWNGAPRLAGSGKKRGESSP